MQRVNPWEELEEPFCELIVISGGIDIFLGISLRLNTHHSHLCHPTTRLGVHCEDDDYADDSATFTLIIIPSYHKSHCGSSLVGNPLVTTPGHKPVPSSPGTI